MLHYFHKIPFRAFLHVNIRIFVETNTLANMSTNQKSDTGIYHSLRPTARMMTEILAYACCPLDYWSLYSVMRQFSPEVNSQKFESAVKTLSQRFQKMKVTEQYNRRTYALDPVFSLHVLLELARDGRNLEQEFPDIKFWNNATVEGKASREAILDYWLEKKLPGDALAIDRYSYTRKLIPATVHVPELDGMECLIPPFDLALEISRGTLERIEALAPRQLVDDWIARFSAPDSLEPDTRHALENARALHSCLLTGQLEEFPTGLIHRFRADYQLTGMYHLYTGNYHEALQLFHRGVNELRYGWEYDQPRFSFFEYGLAIALSLASPEQGIEYYKHSLKLNRAVSGKRCTPVETPHVLTSVILSEDKRERVRRIDFSLKGKDAPAPDTLTALLLHTLARRDETGDPRVMKGDATMLKRVAAAGWKLVLLECYATMPDKQPEYEALSRELGVTALVTRI